VKQACFPEFSYVESRNYFGGLAAMNRRVGSNSLDYRSLWIGTPLATNGPERPSSVP
jgi:hypothetical protein